MEEVDFNNYFVGLRAPLLIEIISDLKKKKIIKIK